MKMYSNYGETGRYVYAVCFNDAGQAWNGSAYATYTTSRDTFDIQLPENGTTGFYGPVNLPGNGPGRYWYIYVRPAGAGTVAHGDPEIAIGFESLDANVVQVDSDANAAIALKQNIAYLDFGVSELAADFAVFNDLIEGMNDRIGLFPGTGTNTVYGFLKAIMRKDFTVPSDIGGTYNPATDSLEAHIDVGVKVGAFTTAALASFVIADTFETTPITGSVCQLAQGASDPEVLLDAPLGALVDHPAGSVGERLLRLPNAAPAAAGGLPTVNASNQVAGVQSAANITSTGGVINVSAGLVTVDDKTGYALSASGNTAVASAVEANATIATGMSDAAAAKVAAEAAIYHASLSFIKDATQDEYTIQWFKNDSPVTSGITLPKIQVVKRSDGTDLIAEVAPTQIGTTGAYKHDATSTNRLSTGESALVILKATIDGSERVWREVLGRDS